MRISTEKRAAHRVHAASPDESELYVEIVSYPGFIDHRTAVQEQQAFLRRRSPDCLVTPAEPSLHESRPCLTFLFEGQLDGKHKLRRFCFVDSAVRTFRIVHDPGSQLNRDVLESWQVREC